MPSLPSPAVVKSVLNSVVPYTPPPNKKGYRVVLRMLRSLPHRIKQRQIGVAEAVGSDPGDAAIAA